MSRSHHTDKDKILSFESLEDYHSYLSNYDSFSRSRMSSFFDGMQSFGSALNSLQFGDDKNVSKAEALMSEMQDQQLFSNGQTIIEPSVIGFIPCVPNALMGVPKSMMARAVSDIQSLNTPLSIYYETTVSAYVTEAQLINRGIAVLAFALAMSKFRPIEVYALSISAAGYRGYAYGIAVKLPTYPIDLARVSWVISSQGYARQLGFSAVKHIQNTNDTGLSKAWYSADNEDRVLSIRDRFNLNQDDVVIIRESEDQNLMCTNPIAWVKQMIAKHCTQME